jgi:hypothetical protein
MLKNTTDKVIDSLIFRSMQHNYSYACDKYGVEKQQFISKNMKTLYGDSWESSKEQIWQWFDTTNGNCESLETIIVLGSELCEN